MKLSRTKLPQVLIMAMALWAVGCGNSPTRVASYNSDAVYTEKLQLNEMPVSSADTAETYYGMVTKCLVEAEEIKPLVKSPGAAVVVHQKIMCSPKMSANSSEELSRRLDAWKKTHCVATVNVKNSSCQVVADPAQNVISNDASAIDQRFKDKDYCVGKKAASYGTLKCAP